MDYSYEEERNAGVDYDSLKQHTYDDTPGVTFYTCPKCGKEYIASFIFEERGRALCVDCWQRIHG